MENQLRTYLFNYRRPHRRIFDQDTIVVDDIIRNTKLYTFFVDFTIKLINKLI